jgi:hypothetical protein
MKNQTSLRELERKVWTSVFQDGLYDLFLGWIILQLGIVYLLTREAYALPDALLTGINLGLYALAVAALMLAKRHITRPRIGQVKFGQRRLTRVAIIVAVITIILTAVFALTLISFNKQVGIYGIDRSPFVGPLTLGVFFLLFFSIPALFLDYKRLFIIAVMFALPEIALVVFHVYLGINIGILAWVVPATIVFLIGAFTLRRFIRDYPVVALPAEEMKHNEN